MHSALFDDSGARLHTRRFLAFAVALSIALHVALLTQLPELRLRREPAASAPAIAIKLREYSLPSSPAPTVAVPETTPEVPEAPRTPSPRATPMHRDSAGPTAAPDAPAAEPQRPVAARDLSPQRLRAIAREIVAEHPADTTPRSGSGAVIFDSVLSARLQRAAGRAAGQPRQPPGDVPAAVSSDAQFDFFELDGLCFRVRRVDPLETLSAAVWYTERCPDR